jgi:hypothetical protein
MRANQDNALRDFVLDYVRSDYWDGECRVSVFTNLLKFLFIHRVARSLMGIPHTYENHVLHLLAILVPCLYIILNMVWATRYYEYWKEVCQTLDQQYGSRCDSHLFEDACMQGLVCEYRHNECVVKYPIDLEAITGCFALAIIESIVQGIVWIWMMVYFFNYCCDTFRGDLQSLQERQCNPQTTFRYNYLTLPLYCQETGCEQNRGCDCCYVFHLSTIPTGACYQLSYLIWFEVLSTSHPEAPSSTLGWLSLGFRGLPFLLWYIYHNRSDQAIQQWTTWWNQVGWECCCAPFHSALHCLHLTCLLFCGGSSSPAVSPAAAVVNTFTLTNVQFQNEEEPGNLSVVVKIEENTTSIDPRMKSVVVCS